MLIMTAKNSTAGKLAVIKHQLESLQPVIDRAKGIYNSKFVSASIWLTVDKYGLRSQEILYFPNPDSIPPQLKDFFAEYLLFLITWQKTLAREATNLRTNKGQRDYEAKSA
jgi:hypothetical protein